VTALVAIVLVVGLAGVGWWLWRLQRDVAGLRAGLDQRTDARVDAHLEHAWARLGQVQGNHARVVEARMQRAEQAAAQIANGHGRLDQRLAVVESWVQYWAQVEP
jgi:hypothetical protein